MKRTTTIGLGLAIATLGLSSTAALAATSAQSSVQSSAQSSVQSSVHSEGRQQPASVATADGADRVELVEAKLNANRFAVVDANGTLSRGKNAAFVGKVGTGTYEVIFDRDIRNCAFVATIGQTDIGIADPGEITVARRALEDRGVFVETSNSSGVPTDRPFHLTVTC